MDPKYERSPPCSSQTPLLTTDAAERQNLAFAKVALTFHDRLNALRTKSSATVSNEKTPTNAAVEVESKDELKTESHKRTKKAIRIIRICQGLLTATLSIIIAVFQGRAYWTYIKTQDVSNAWPDHPQLFATLLLFGVATGAFAFDVFLLVAYLTPDVGIARKAFHVANKIHFVIISSKTVSYAITAAVCRTGFNYGNESGSNKDLWSWTCSGKAGTESLKTQMSGNCTTQVCNA
jgi:hypothetical protein